MATLEQGKVHADRVEVVRVAGDLPGPFAMSRAELRQARCDLTFVWDPRALNAEEAAKLMAAIREVLALDTSGNVDRTRMMMDLISLLSPYATDRWMRNQEAVTGQEIKDEDEALKGLLVGIEAPYNADAGQNVELRLQVMGEREKSPVVQETLSSRPGVRELWDKRKQAFQFVISQRNNAAIGRRMGVTPDSMMGQVR
jgi:hypothetical protein